jgi:mono/diheme cytochrome c family protein
MVKALAPALLSMAFTVVAQTPPAAQSIPPRSGPNHNGWQILENAGAEQNPVKPTPESLADGKRIYQKHCQRCHGSAGIGDGPDADPNERPDDLTDPGRAVRNPDGVMFYKIWNGRKKPHMPGFKDDLSDEDVWTVINYIKTLRKATMPDDRPA